MNKKYRLLLLILIIVAIIAALVWYLNSHSIAVLQPAGQIGYKERSLIIFALILSAIVVIPTFSLAIFIIWKYRESNPRPKKYNPDWDHSRLFETIWWGIPIVIIGILAVTVWKSSHSLDPWRSLASTKQPLTVQVISLDWKWLFIYPQQNIASVNFLEIPVNTPVDFYLTSDSVMNSFWIPQLGGQIYEMPGMSTQLHLVADRTGNFFGTPANISGAGFSDMTFKVKSVPAGSFNSWINSAATSPHSLSSAAYASLAKPSQNNPVAYYSGVQNGLYDYVVTKYMTPDASLQNLGATNIIGVKAGIKS